MKHLLTTWCIHCWLGIYFLCFVVTTQAQESNGDKVPLRNAYEVAKWMNKAGSGQLLEAQQQQMLGSLLWYANLQDEKGQVFRKLFDKLWNYPALIDIAEQLSGKMLKYDTLFNMDSASVRRKIEEYVPKTTVKSAFIDRYNDYLKLLRGLNEYRKQNGDALINAKQKLAQLLQERESETTTLGDSLRLMQARSFVETANNDSLRKIITQLDTDLIGLHKAKDSLIQEQREIITRFETGMASRQGRVDAMKKDLVSFMMQNLFTLRDFLFQISGVDPNPDQLSIVLQQSLDQYSKHTAADVQQLITAAEAAAKTSLRLPTEAEMINALAIYLANRIKQESVMWFFEKITQHAGRYTILNLFFPSTIRLLQGNEVYEIPNLGAQWQYALSKDFMQMPTNVLRSDWLKKRWPGIEKYGPYITGTLEFAELIAKRYSYREAIRSLYLSMPTPSNDDKSGFQFRDYISILYAINTELFLADSTGTLRMLSYEDLRSMSRNEIEIMLSLMDLKYEGAFSKLIKGVSIPANTPSKVALDVEKIRRMLGSLQHAIGRVEKIGADYMDEQRRMQQSGQKDWFYTTYNVWGSIYQVFDVLNGIDQQLVNDTILHHARKAFQYGGHVFEIYNLITKKNFAGAVLNTLSLIDTLLYEHNDESYFSISYQKIKNNDSLFSSTHLKNHFIHLIDSGKWKNVAGLKYDSSNDTLYFTKNSPIAAVLFDDERHALQLIRKLSGFLNDAALAQGDKQLAKVVESYAMPVGSYKRKRNNWWSVDLNAFAGPYVGYEWSRRQKNDLIGGNAAKSGGVWGFSVPIGISLSKTFGSRWKKSNVLSEDMIRNPDKIKLLRNRLHKRSGWTITLTGSIVDLGAVVSYRLGNTPGDTTINQSFKWSQFISPGIHLAVALPGSPFVVSTGLQYTPQLRRYEEAGKPNEKQFNTTRVYLGLMFDLPLFNFWERKHIVYRK